MWKYQVFVKAASVLVISELNNNENQQKKVCYWDRRQIWSLTYVEAWN